MDEKREIGGDITAVCSKREIVEIGEAVDAPTPITGRRRDGEELEKGKKVREEDGRDEEF